MKSNNRKERTDHFIIYYEFFFQKAIKSTVSLMGHHTPMPVNFIVYSSLLYNGTAFYF